MESLIRICDALDCERKDVVELVKAEEKSLQFWKQGIADTMQFLLFCRNSVLRVFFLALLRRFFASRSKISD